MVAYDRCKSFIHIKISKIIYKYIYIIDNKKMALMRLFINRSYHSCMFPLQHGCFQGRLLLQSAFSEILDFES